MGKTFIVASSIPHNNCSNGIFVHEISAVWVILLTHLSQSFSWRAAAFSQLMCLVFYRRYLISMRPTTREQMHHPKFSQERGTVSLPFVFNENSYTVSAEWSA